MLLPTISTSFGGGITGEDGQQYNFNGGSWINKTLTLADVAADQEVEFELKAPTPEALYTPD